MVKQRLRRDCCKCRKPISEKQLLKEEAHFVFGFWSHKECDLAFPNEIKINGGMEYDIIRME